FDEPGTVLGDLASTGPRFRPVTKVCQDRRLPPNPVGSRTAIPSLTHAIAGSAVVRPGEALRVGLKVCRTPFLSPPLAESNDIGLSREQEFKEADAAVLAGLVDAQQDEVVREGVLPHPAVGDPAVVSERLDRVLGVVVPRDAIVVQ